MDAAEMLQERIQGFFPGVLGISFLEATPDRIKAEVVLRDELCTVPGMMHGGAIMAFADTLGAVATVLNLPSGAGTTTLESKTNFFRPVTTGGKAVAECLPLHKGKRTMVWQTTVNDENDKLVALITQTQMVLSQ